MTKITFTQEATQNLLAQALYIYKQTLDAEKSDRYFLTMKTHILHTLTYFPMLGRPAEEFGEGIRKLVHQKYSILYLIDENNIYIIAIYKENMPHL